jgi:hypothetical protein
MLLMFSGTLLVLVKTVLRVLDALISTVPNASGEGLNETVGYAPVPVRLIVSVASEVLSVMVTVALRVPVLVGVKLTVMVQLAPAATLLPQVLVWE